MDLNKWIKETHLSSFRFSGYRRSGGGKKETGVSISLCIPTLNEEATIGKEIILFRSELMQRHPLLDEIAVIDSGSTDNTLKVASSFGADTYLAADILPNTPPKRGKGENLWKAIYQLKGDIIVYIDADIKNIHPRFVYGLLGPILLNQEVKYVKAFYDRPIAFFRGDSAFRGRSGNGNTHPSPLLPLFPGALGDRPSPSLGSTPSGGRSLSKSTFPSATGSKRATCWMSTSSTASPPLLRPIWISGSI